MNQIEPYQKTTAIVDLETGQIEIHGQQYQMVPVRVQSSIAKNEQINKSGWSVVQVCGMAIVGCVVAVVGIAALTPPPPPAPYIIQPAPPAPDKTCVLSFGC